MQVLVGLLVGYFLCSLVIALMGGITLFKLRNPQAISKKDVHLRFGFFVIFWLPIILYWIWADWIRKPR